MANRQKLRKRPVKDFRESADDLGSVGGTGRRSAIHEIDLRRLETDTSFIRALGRQRAERGLRLARAEAGEGLASATDLSFLVARVPAEAFEDLAVLLDLKPRELVALMHGDGTMTEVRAKRVRQVNELLHSLHAVLDPSATSRWLHTEIAAFGGKSPLAMVKTGRINSVVTYAGTYTDPTYS